jgi:D-alanyl-lipoteichoic acid acyltransferase DltB (MBOAT superfamily)
LSYTIDLYRRDEKGSHSLLTYLSAASFFPILQAGPIARLTELTKQLDFPKINPARGGQAFFLIGTGLLKKALIADYLADNFVNRIFDTPNLYSGAEVLLGVYAYSLQLYYDFSGYTDIARGAGMLLGLDLPINFDRPYLSANVAEFWRRWHISFSNWLRDYLYFSLPGGRTKVMPYISLAITMAAGGLWHGITWNFAIWGLLHGIALAVVKGWQAWRGRRRETSWWGRAAAIFVTYQFVCFTWIFFRAANVPAAMTVLTRIGSLTGGLANVSLWIASVLALGAAALFFRKAWYARVEGWFASSPFYVHAAGLAAVVVALELLGGQGSAPFVYSKF